MNQNNPISVRELGYFLNYRHWLQALELLKYQLKRKKANRHFNTLEMSYYEKLEKDFEKLKDEDYFITKIANNRFYGLSKEFAVVPCTIPKSKLGLRRYKFMTCPMRILYYAIGIYLLELSKGYLRESHHVHQNIHANYGGNLGLNDQGELILKPDRVYYKSHYDDFCDEVRKENKGSTEHKIVIRLDMQNYFDELSIPKLLELLQTHVDDSTQQKMRYDEATQAQLVSFFDFVADGTSGIPQSNNNILSDFIGYLFLVFGDLYIDDELDKHSDLLDYHSIIRYMDDIYVSLTFKEQDSDLRAKFNSVAPCISDCLNEKLGLRLNPKTMIFRLSEENDRKALERNLKMVSPDETGDADNTDSPKKKIKNIFKQLKKLKGFPIAPYFQGYFKSNFNEEEFKDTLRGVYDDNVQKRLENRHTPGLRKIFTGSGGFDFHLVNAAPMPIIILILMCNDVQKEFETFLFLKTNLTSRDIFLVLNYFCQIGSVHNCETELTQCKLLELLKQDPPLKKIVEIFEAGELSPELLGYFDLTQEQTLKIEQPYILEQIKLRILCEQKGDYSVALNHLLNEIQATCHALEGTTTKLKNYGQTQVIEFLKTQKVPYETRAQIKKLFDRRHKSTVSHPDPIAWPVDKNGYDNYRRHVANCLKYLL